MNFIYCGGACLGASAGEPITSVNPWGSCPCSTSAKEQLRRPLLRQFWDRLHEQRNAIETMMSLLHGLQRLYYLDTLDTRFTVSSNTPLKALAADTRSSSPPSAGGRATRDPSAGKDAKAQEIATGAQPSKWRTPEFYFYYFVFLTVVPMMFKTVIDLSQGWSTGESPLWIESDSSFAESHPTYSNYSNLLSPGWIPGRKVVCLHEFHSE